VPVSLIVSESGQLSTTELNSLIGHAHRQIDQLQRQLVEQSALEPLRLEAALETQRASDERLLDEKVSHERQSFAAEITKLRDAWVCYHCDWDIYFIVVIIRIVHKLQNVNVTRLILISVMLLFLLFLI